MGPAWDLSWPRWDPIASFIGSMEVLHPKCATLREPGEHELLPAPHGTAAWPVAWSLCGVSCCRLYLVSIAPLSMTLYIFIDIYAHMCIYIYVYRSIYNCKHIDERTDRESDQTRISQRLQGSLGASRQWGWLPSALLHSKSLAHTAPTRCRNWSAKKDRLKGLPLTAQLPL